jgi:hypothetical protein
MPNVVYWHKADMPVVSLNALSGAKRTSAAIAGQLRFYEYTP